MANLPDGYIELEYIESTGTQYIDTGIQPTQNTRIDLKVSTTQTGSHTMAGSDISWTGNGFSIGVGFAHYGTETANISGMNDGNVHEISLDKNVLSVDGEVKHTFSSQTFSVSYNLVLFANNRSGSISEMSEANWYPCKIYQNGILVQDLQPCINASGEVGLYDLVYGTFYPNAGTGDFIAGPEVPQNEITITGVPSNLGELAGNSSFNYIVSDTLGSGNISVTEKIDSSVLRTYLVNSGDNQTFTIDISTLDSGAHSYTVEASIGDITSSASGIFSIADNVITIEGLPNTLINVNKNFQLKYTVYDTAGSQTFTATNSVDNQIISSFTTTTSKTNVVDINISNLNEGYHTFYVQAVASVGSITKSVEFYVNKDVQGYISKSVRRLRIKINILNFQMQTVDEISGNVLDGNITEDANSDIRRTCNISMVVTDGQFNVQPGGQIWLDKYFQIYIGLDNLYTGETQWFNKGIYLIDQPTYSFDPVTSTLTFQGYDLMCKMTGLRNGYLEGIPTVIPQGSNIRESMIATVTQLGGFTKYAIQENPQTVPYDIQIDPGGTVYDILVALRDILPSWQIYFDEDGVFHYNPIPSGQNEPVMFYDDTWSQVVLSESINTDFSAVKNVVEVWGKTLSPAHYADATVSGNTYQLNIADVSSYRKNMLYGFTAPSIIENPQVQINSLGALPIVNEDGTNAVIPEADIYYVVKYQEIAGETESDPVTKNFLFMGYQQPYAVAEDDNPESPFYVDGPVGKIRIVLQGGDYDNIYTNDLAMQRAEYELWTRTRLEDNVTLSCIPIYSLQTNTVVSKTLTNETEPTLFIIKTITTNLSYTGTQSVQMITYYPLYPDI